jgi:hypothetical protein
MADAVTFRALPFLGALLALMPTPAQLAVNANRAGSTPSLIGLPSRQEGDLEKLPKHIRDWRIVANAVAEADQVRIAMS